MIDKFMDMIDEFMDWFFDTLFKTYEMIRDGCIIIVVFAFLVITLPIWILPFIFWLFFVWAKKDTDVSKQTNADRIRSMSDVELAESRVDRIDFYTKSDIPEYIGDFAGIASSIEEAIALEMKWLQSEVEK